MIIFEGKTFKKVVKDKWCHKGGALIQYDLCYRTGEDTSL